MLPNKYFHSYFFRVFKFISYFQNIRKETVKEIAEIKMSSVGFYLDIISVFPVSIFTDTLDPNGETVAGQIAMLFPILQVWHLWDYLTKWASNFDSHVKVCNDKKKLLFVHQPPFYF